MQVKMSTYMQVLYRYPIQICHICDISILWGNGLHFSRSYHRFCSIARVFLLFTVLIDPLTNHADQKYISLCIGRLLVSFNVIVSCKPVSIQHWTCLVALQFCIISLTQTKTGNIMSDINTVPDRGNWIDVYS